MKKLFLSLICAALVFTVRAQTTVNVTSSVEDALNGLGVNPSTITYLVVASGQLNPTDFDFIKGSMSVLQTLNTTGANVSGNAIPDFAFAGKASLTTVTLPATVTHIGQSAFSGCTSLVTIILPAITDIGQFAFADCHSLTSISLPSSLTDIGEAAFANSGLTSITIPSSISGLGVRAFYQCDALSSVNISEGVTSIATSVFAECISLRTINIPSTVTNVEVDAFYLCANLQSITVDNGNSSYSASDGILFDKNKTVLIQYPNDKAGNTYSILSSVTTVASHAFAGCFNLTSVTITENVSSITGGCFEQCINLASVNVVSENSYYTSDNGVLFDNARTLLVYYPSAKTGPYVIPFSVSSIGKGAFAYCSGLTAVSIHDGLTGIENNAFSYCTGLTAISIPASVSMLGDYIFAGCNSLGSIFAYRPLPLVISTDVFDQMDQTTCTLHVPTGSLMSYQTAVGWQNFTNKVEANLITVTFDTQGGAPATFTSLVMENALLAIPATPVNGDYTFAGWYQEPNCDHTWNFFSDVVAGAITLYALWSSQDMIIIKGNLDYDDKLKARPVAYVTVILYGKSKTEPKSNKSAPVGYPYLIAQTTTDINGNFCFSVPRGDYALWLDMPGYILTTTIEIKGTEELHVTEFNVNYFIDQARYTITGQRVLLASQSFAKESEISQARIYPNPAIDEVRVALDVNMSYVVKIFNAMGQLLISTNSSDFETMVDVSNFRPGIYYVRIEAHNMMNTYKLVKQ